MEEKKDKKKGFFASLFTPKTCSCGVQIEELAENENPKKDLKKKEEKASKENDADMAVCGFERIDLKTNKVVGKDKDQNTTCCCG